jgi:hypothetical protein
MFVPFIEKKNISLKLLFLFPDLMAMEGNTNRPGSIVSLIELETVKISREKNKK